MNVRIRWQSATGKRAFPLRAQPLHLIWDGESLDQSHVALRQGDGLSVEPPDEKSMVRLESRGRLSFESGGKSFRKVRLPLGRGVRLQLDGESIGLLAAEAAGPSSAAGSTAASTGQDSEVRDDRPERPAAGSRTKEVDRAKDPRIGREIGGYRLLGRLGSGAVGIVYRALQINLDREVALKVLNDEAARDPKMVASFNREAVAAGRLSHPNLVQVHDVGEQDGLFFYSMELVSGGSLEHHLREDGPLPWEEAIEAVREAALALAYAEEHQLVHRDVKPENLMVAASGHVKLADLGLAATRGMIDREAAGGTPHFMAPEARGGHPVDHRADLYSLGCTLFRLLTGKTVFQGATVREILRAHRDQPPPTLREAGVEVPGALEELVARLLEKNPEKRPQHASEVVEACHALVHKKAGRGALVALVLVLIAGGAYAGYEMTREKASVDPEVVTIVEEDEASKQEARRLRIQLDFLGAMDKEEGPARVAALEEFLRDHPRAEQAERARAEIERIHAEAAADRERAEAARLAHAEALRSVREDVRGLLAEGRPAAALARLDAETASEDSPLATEDLRPLRSEAGDWVEDRFSGIEEGHAAALEDSNWERATRLRSVFRDLLDDPEHPAPDSWTERWQALVTAASDAEAKERRAIFEGARQTLLIALQERIEPALMRLDAVTASRAFHEAYAQLRHDGLREAAAGSRAAFAVAARAASALAQRVGAAEPIEFVEPKTDKHAVLLGYDADGVVVEVQVQGERVQRRDAWSLYLRPAALSGLLRASLPPQVDDDAVNALYLLVAQARLAAEVRGWAAALPTEEEARDLAAEIRTWIERLPRRLASPPEWLEEQSTRLLHFGEVCEALGRGDDYLALLRLEEFLEGFSLFGAWVSDGSGTWGLEP